MVMALVVLASPAQAQVRFFTDGKEASTGKNGEAKEITATATVSKAKRTKKFDRMDVALQFDGSGVEEYVIDEAPKDFLKRFKGDVLKVVILTAGGAQGTTILSNTKQNLTWPDLVVNAKNEGRPTQKLTLVVRGWNLTGYTTKEVWEEGLGKWVKKKEPVWKWTKLVEGTFEITGADAGRTADQYYMDAKWAWQSNKDKEALELAERAAKMGKPEGYELATEAACSLKDEAKAKANFAKVRKEYRTSVKERCEQRGMKLE